MPLSRLVWEWGTHAFHEKGGFWEGAGAPPQGILFFMNFVVVAGEPDAALGHQALPRDLRRGFEKHMRLAKRKGRSSCW